MIETDRLILRRFEERDRAPLHAMWADPRVMADLGPVKSAADSDAALARHASYDPLGFFVVERCEDGATIGFCGLKPGAPDTPIANMLEVGWMLAVPWWGGGYAREAAAASIAWGWATCGDAAIVAITARRNARSRGLMERLGMRHIPAMDFTHPLFAPDDPLSDTVTYRIERP
ncbi:MULTISPECIES: GNAT family N-acetyltransferase [unclassified Sphingomonas]|uniref:GNAT family N-acetyltransferase n=1 Tax=unclassified Sphingomonas TaxID=196159 RepID=UPI0009289042|nr:MULTISPECIES: GNAT family N-acetyltransferase [unclassified Sphingomonas]MBN8846975.1 GNAT family N-acetyltransferase [Sphingomonas sp.]OJV27414.1 MAG: GNAT family N-acetyltransferase [Sphingomonas sp. 67-36]